VVTAGGPLQVAAAVLVSGFSPALFVIGGVETLEDERPQRFVVHDQPSSVNDEDAALHRQP